MIEIKEFLKIKPLLIERLEVAVLKTIKTMGSNAKRITFFRCWK